MRETIISFLGDYDQIPPMYSALKVNGKKLYELARAGKEVERQARRVRILEMEIHEIRLPEVTFTVTCSSGTYIRTLCQDIGEKLGCGGCMKSLLRTKVDRFELADSHKLSELEAMMHAGRIGEVLLPVDDVFAACPAVRIRQESDRLIQNGNPFGKEDIAETTGERPAGRVRSWSCNCVRVYNSEGDFRGLYRREQGGRRYKPEKMFLS